MKKLAFDLAIIFICTFIGLFVSLNIYREEVKTALEAQCIPETAAHQECKDQLLYFLQGASGAVPGILFGGFLVRWRQRSKK